MALTREQYNRIMRVLDGRRSEAAAVLAARREEIETKIPAWVRCGEELHRINREEMSARFAKDTEKVRQLAAERAALLKTRTALLVEYGYPETYLEKPYFCAACGDTGFLPEGEKCACFRRLEADLVNSEAGLPGFLKGAEFDRISPEVYDDSAPMPDLPRGVQPMTQRQYMKKQILPRAAAYLASFEEPGSHNIFMTGPSGTGKTYLSACIAGKLMEQLHTCIYLGAGELFELYTAVTFNRGDTEALAARWSTIENCELLIIDDLGTEFLTELNRSGMFSLISRRLSLGVSTIISSNLDLNTVEKAYGDRVASRIKGNYQVFSFFGTDLRLRLRAEKQRSRKAEEQRSRKAEKQ